MSAEFRAFFLAIAIVLFVIAAWDEFRRTPNRPTSLGLIGAGLACAFFPAAWDAVDLALD